MTGTYTEDTEASPIGEADLSLVNDVSEKIGAAMGVPAIEVELAILRAMANPPSPEIIEEGGKARRWIWKPAERD